jgi:hypothetical protein
MISAWWPVGRVAAYARALLGVPRVSGELDGFRPVVNSSRSDRACVVEDLFVAACLRSAGAEPVVLIDDGRYPHSVDASAHRGATMRAGLRHILYRTLVRGLPRPTGVSFVTPGELGITSATPPAAPTGEWLAPHVEATISRFFEGFELSGAVPPARLSRVAERVSGDARRSWHVAGLACRALEPGAWLTSHGIYSRWGPGFDRARQSGVSAMVYAHNVYSGKLTFLDYPDEFCARDRRFQPGVDLPHDWEDVAEAIMRNRLTARAADNAMLFGDAPAGDGAWDDTPYVVMCPNVVWDGNVRQRHVAFRSMVDWVVHTIRWFAAARARRLVIRCHPAEAHIYPGSVKLEHLIRILCGDLLGSPWVSIVGSAEPVNTYGLLRGATAALVYDGMPAVEAAYLGLPVILAGQGRFVGHGFTHDAASVADYDSALERLVAGALPPPTENVKRAALQFLYRYTVWGNWPTPWQSVSRDVPATQAVRRWLDGEDRGPMIAELISRLRPPR